MTDVPTYRKKLIEVALPLDAINRESAREKSIRHGHPSTLHLWWARRPLAACRAVLFASLVDDPSSRPDEFPTEEAQDAERQRLFRLIEELVKWENLTNETVLAAARAEILKSTGGNPPPVLDPFCGGGSIPLEAQRLGLEAHASDLNPVPVLITKALIEIPPKFAGMPPRNPSARKNFGHSGKWKGAAGLAEDVRYYGKWMRDEAERRIGHLYPKVKLPKAHGGGKATVIAWLWARTVTCPNPACGARMPLVRSFALATKKGKEAWVEPVVNRTQRPPTIQFVVKTGKGNSPEGTVNRRGATCIACGMAVPFDHVRAEAKARRMGAQLMALAVDGARQRVYLPPDSEQESIASSAVPAWVPESDLPEQALGFRVQLYGMTRHSDLFTRRQLVALTTLCDLVIDARERVLTDARAAGMPADGRLTEGGAGADAYADAVASYLACSVSAALDDMSTIVTWRSGHGTGATRSTFARQALPMTWDFAEANPLAGATGDIATASDAIAQVVGLCPGMPNSTVTQADATRRHRSGQTFVVSTDPPYYDNIGYADLSDFFYIWLRHSLSDVHPALFATLLTPKSEEMIASPYRFGGDKGAAQRFFETRLGHAFERMREVQDTRFPLTVFYAFKQSESVEDEEADASQGGADSVASTGWETMLEGLIRSGFLVDGTWPMRTERSARSISIGTNALASSIALVCRPRAVDAPSATRRQFLIELQRDLPGALRNLQHGNIAPVDLAQAAIGPGMAVFSRYAHVLENDGSPMRVRTALAHINQVLAEVLAEQDGEMDADTRWALTWFEQFGFADGPFGDADTLAKAKNTATEGLVDAGIIASARGRVRLLRRDELPVDWDPAVDGRRTVWECAHHLIRALEAGGESAAAALLARLGEDGERARDLAYRLYVTCERRGWAQDALAYNSLVVAWPEVSRQASSMSTTSSSRAPAQASLAL